MKKITLIFICVTSFFSNAQVWAQSPESCFKLAYQQPMSASFESMEFNDFSPMGPVYKIEQGFYSDTYFVMTCKSLMYVEKSNSEFKVKWKKAIDDGIPKHISDDDPYCVPKQMVGGVSDGTLNTDKAGVAIYHKNKISVYNKEGKIIREAQITHARRPQQIQEVMALESGDIVYSALKDKEGKDGISRIYVLDKDGNNRKLFEFPKMSAEEESDLGFMPGGGLTLSKLDKNKFLAMKHKKLYFFDLGKKNSSGELVRSVVLKNHSVSTPAVDLEREKIAINNSENTSLDIYSFDGKLKSSTVLPGASVSLDEMNPVFMNDGTVMVPRYAEHGKEGLDGRIYAVSDKGELLSTYHTYRPNFVKVDRFDSIMVGLDRDARDIALVSNKGDLVGATVFPKNLVHSLSGRKPSTIETEFGGVLVGGLKGRLVRMEWNIPGEEDEDKISSVVKVPCESAKSGNRVDEESSSAQ